MDCSKRWLPLSQLVAQLVACSSWPFMVKSPVWADVPHSLPDVTSSQLPALYQLSQVCKPSLTTGETGRAAEHHSHKRRASDSGVFEATCCSKTAWWNRHLPRKLAKVRRFPCRASPLKHRSTCGIGFAAKKNGTTCYWQQGLSRLISALGCLCATNRRKLNSCGSWSCRVHTRNCWVCPSKANARTFALGCSKQRHTFVACGTC